MSLTAAELSDGHFKRVCRLVYHFSGIHLKEGKEALVKTRLMKRLRALKMENFDDYLSYVESHDGDCEVNWMIDVMTTNQTSFFREPAHFDFLRERYFPNLKNEKLRFWSAACSTGQEPYSLAMLIKDNVSDFLSKDIRILATDISQSVLERARNGQYPQEQLKGMTKEMIRKHFSRIDDKSSNTYKIKEDLRLMISFAWLNLTEGWPMKGPFQVIFCRNVMIYFDRLTQQKLVRRFWDLLEPGGYLFVGHSEGLSAISHSFQYVQPAIYKK
jgi:chemotaxis protein methyltransferase CheR